MAPAANNVVQTLRSEHLRPAEQSPITETFSTPPSSPFPPPAPPPTATAAISPQAEAQRSLSTVAASANQPPPFERRSSKTKPQSIHLEEGTNMAPNVTLDITSPNASSSDSTAVQSQSLKTPRPEGTNSSSAHLHAPHTRTSNASHSPLPTSPCFVHSLLDRGASLRNFIELNSAPSPGAGYAYFPGTGTSTSSTSTSSSSPVSDSGHGSSIKSDPLSSLDNSATAANMLDNPAGVGIARVLDEQHPHDRRGSAVDSDLSVSDEEDEGNSLTKQLAETAVGVRELSKQLGRARVRTNISSVLIVTKARDNRLIQLTRQLAIYLMQKRSGDGQRGLTVYVDYQLRKSKRFDAAGIQRDHPEFFVPTPRRRSSGGAQGFPGFTSLNGQSDEKTQDEGQLRYWTSDMCTRNAHLFDFVVTLGGDGTVLFTSWLFQRIVPPVLPFALGSLGFLTNFDFEDYASVMDSAIDNGIRVNLRMRFTCTVYRAVAPEEGKGSKAVKKAETGEILMKNLEKGGWEALEGGGGLPLGVGGGKKKDKEIMCFTTRPVETFEVLNDLVVDRGPSPYVSLLELFGDEHHMTTVQADGLTVSTPTGSTAYSLSAGGSLVHPEIPALLITPICPHTLSFRPMLLPDSMELRICVPYNSRSTAWASFDGRGRVELKQGDHIKVTASKFPFPTVCADKQSTDWFHAIARTLKWNERERQKSFVVVEEGPARHTSKKSKPPSAAASGGEEEETLGENDEEDEEAEAEEEEDKFDIDDSSPEAAAQAGAGAAAGNGGLPVENPKVNSDTDRRPPSSGIGTPDRFVSTRPHPPPTIPSHLISDAAERLRAEEHARGSLHPQTHRKLPLQVPPPVSTSTSQRSPAAQREMQARGEDGERDFIRAPEREMQSNKSKIPRDRDVEADSMRTPRPDSSSHHHHHHSPHSNSNSGSGSGRIGTARSPLQQAGGPWGQTPTAQTHSHRNHRRHGSVDSSIGAPRRAFAAWGRDESDSNASDSDC